MEMLAWPAAAFGIAAIGTWLCGLRVARAPANAALTARIHRHRKRVAFVVGVAPIVTILLAERWGGGARADPGLVPLTLVLLLAASLGATAGDTPVARAHLGDRSTIVARVVDALRWRVAMLGLWIAMVALPSLVHRAAPPWDWGVAVAGAVALLLWGSRFPDVVARLVGASPIDDDDLRARFEEILARSSAPRPRIGAFGSRDGGVLNAFALPSLSPPRVLFTRSLLQRLPPEQTAAVFAHEVAHLEDFDPALLRRWRLQGWTLTLTAAFGAPLLARWSEPATQLFLWGWMGIVLVVLVLRGRKSQDRERFSDLRGAELCGDREASVASLVAMYAANHLPRRVSAEHERASSHPSLARRIRAIRGEEGSPPPGAPQEFVSRRDPNRRLVVGEDRLGLLVLPPGEEAPERAVSRRDVPLRDLVELRVLHRRRGPVLRAVETNETKHEFAIRTDDLDRLQARLDEVDALLAPLPPGGGAARFARFLVLVIIIGIAFLGAGQSPFAVLFLCVAALVAVLRKGRPHFVALGAAVVFLIVHEALLRAAIGPGAVVVLAAGATLLYLAGRRRLPREGNATRTAAAHGGVALAFLAASLATFVDGHAALRAFSLARHGTLVLLPWVASAAVLVAGRRRRLGFALFVLLAALLACGSGLFLRRVVGDPLAVELPPVRWTSVDYRPAATITVDEDCRDLQVAPDGAHVVAQDHFDSSIPCTLYGRDGSSAPIPGEWAVFAGPDAILARHARTLRLSPVADPARALWTVELPDWTRDAVLELAASGDAWRVTSRRDRRWTIRYRGTFASQRIETDEWLDAVPDEHERTPGPGPVALDLAPQFVPRGRKNSRERLWWWLHQGFAISRISRVEGERSAPRLLSGLQVRGIEAQGDGPALCLVDGSGPTRAWTYDFERDEFTPRVALELDDDVRWDGRRLVARTRDGIGSVRVAEREGTRAAFPGTLGEPVLLAAAGPWVALGIWREEHGMRVDILRLP